MSHVRIVTARQIDRSTLARLNDTKTTRTLCGAAPTAYDMSLADANKLAGDPAGLAQWVTCRDCRKQTELSGRGKRI